MNKLFGNVFFDMQMRVWRSIESISKFLFLFMPNERHMSYLNIKLKAFEVENHHRERERECVCVCVCTYKEWKGNGSLQEKTIYAGMCEYVRDRGREKRMLKLTSLVKIIWAISLIWWEERGRSRGNWCVVRLKGRGQKVLFLFLSV